MQLGGQDAQQVRMGGRVVDVHEVDVGTGNPDLRAQLPPLGRDPSWGHKVLVGVRGGGLAHGCGRGGPEPGERLGESASDVGGEVENTNVGHVERLPERGNSASRALMVLGCRGQLRRATRHIPPGGG